MFARPLAKLRSVNSNSASFPSVVDTLTEPVGDAGTAAGATVIDIADRGNGRVPMFLELWPYGLGASNDTFSMRLIGWQRVVPPIADGRLQWTPTPICELACTVGASTGVAGGQVLNTELYVDTITVVSEETLTADVTRLGTVLIYSPANDTKARVRIELEGMEKIQILFDQTLNTPTMNALYRLYDPNNP